MNKQEVYSHFQKMFEDQLGLQLSDVLTINDGKYVLHMDMMALSIGSLKLEMSPEEHGLMAKLLEDVMADRQIRFC